MWDKVFKSKFWVCNVTHAHDAEVSIHRAESHSIIEGMLVSSGP